AGIATWSPTTTGESSVALNGSPALLRSVLTSSIRRMESVVPSGTVTRTGAAGAVGASVGMGGAELDANDPELPDALLPLEDDALWARARCGGAAAVLRCARRGREAGAAARGAGAAGAIGGAPAVPMSAPAVTVPTCRLLTTVFTPRT